MPIRALCVYCGSSSLVPASHLQAARDLGALAAGAGVDIVYGGGRVGMMGAVAEGAQAAGGRVVGIIPQDPDALEAGNRTASEYLVVNSMHARQAPMPRMDSRRVGAECGSAVRYRVEQCHTKKNNEIQTR